MSPRASDAMEYSEVLAEVGGGIYAAVDEVEKKRRRTRKHLGK